MPLKVQRPLDEFTISAAKQFPILTRRIDSENPGHVTAVQLVPFCKRIYPLIEKRGLMKNLKYIPNHSHAECHWRMGLSNVLLKRAQFSNLLIKTRAGKT